MASLPQLLFFPDWLQPDQIRDVAQGVDRAGFDILWSTELDFDSFVYNQFVASLTDRVRVGSSIFRYYKRHPLQVAEAAAAMDRLAPGRHIIGVGTGPVKRTDPAVKLQRWGTAAGDPIEKMEEYLDL